MDTKELMRKRIIAILLAAMTMAAVVTGCGEEDDDEIKALIKVSYHHADKLEDYDIITVIRDGNVIVAIGKIDADMNEDEYIIRLSEGTHKIISDSLGKIEVTIDNPSDNYEYYELYVDYETQEFIIYETEAFAIEE